MIHDMKGKLNYDMDKSCKFLSDTYDKYEETNPNDKDTLDDYKKEIDRCNRQQAMVSLEYTSLNVNLVIGFICSVLGLLNYLNLGNIGKIGGLIGLGGGVVGFVLTFVYVIESGLVFDDYDNNKYRIDSDGAFLEWDDSKNSYTCIFYEKDNKDSIYIKYSNYGNKYLSYNKDTYLTFIKDDKYQDITGIKGCNAYNINGINTLNWNDCKNMDEKVNQISKVPNCNKLFYINTSQKTNTYKIIFDKWLTSIIFSCFIFLLDIGLALFGFLLFRESNGSSGAVSIK